MSNLSPFQFKQFALFHHKSALKIGTDSVLLASVILGHQSKFVLDIGCGCGVILFCIAAKNFQERNDLQFYTGVDIDQESIEEALENWNQFPYTNNQWFRFLHTSIQEFAIENMEYDLIVSNPPYFGDSLKSPCEKKQRSKHRDAHLSFEDLATSVDTLLSKDGFFYLILPPHEMNEFNAIISQKGLFSCFQMNIYPIQEKPIHRIIKGYCKKNPPPFEILDLWIRESTQEYSEQYKRITKQFYLNF